MPKVFVTRQEKLNSDLAAYIYGRMRVNKITQESMAKRLGIKQPSLNYKLRHGSFTFQDLTAIFDVLKPDAETLSKLMGMQ